MTPINEGIHLGEPLGRERVPAEDERDDTDLAGVAEEFIDLSNRLADRVPRGKECQCCAFYHRRAPRRPRAQRHGNQEEDEERDRGAGL